VLRFTGLTVACLVALLFIARAVVEIATVNPFQPDTYRDDWGGPSYVGVLLVHAGPGLLAVVLVALVLRRRARNRDGG